MECISLTSNKSLLPQNSKINQNNISNRALRSNSIGSYPQPPPVPPKPQFKRLHSIGGNINSEQQTIEEKIIASRKKSLELKAASTSSNESGNSMLINELSTILAKQKKKIEDSINGVSGTKEENNEFPQSNKLINDRIVTSPTLTKKPPPPPRTDRSNLSRRPSNDSNI